MKVGGINGSGNGGLSYRPAALGSPAVSITYNKERKASSITAGGNTIAYRYNEAGLRVSKRVNNQLTLLDPHYEWHSTANDLERKVYFGSRLLAISKGRPKLAERSDCRIKSNGTLRCRTAKLSKAIKLPTKYGLGWELANQNERKYVHAPTTVSWTPPYENAHATALIKIKLDDRSNSQCSGTTTLRITADEVIERSIPNLERLSEKLEIPITGNTPIQFEVATANNCQERLRGDITIKYKGNITNTTPPQSTTPRSASFLHRDHRASTILVTDKTAAIQQYARYEAYGMTKVFDAAGNSVPLCSATTPYLFTGHRLDCHTNLHDMQARDLDSVSARFTTHDPAGEGQNPYAHVLWNPTNFIDPTGEYAESGIDYTSLMIGLSDIEQNGIGFWNSVGVVGDGVALALPAVPGGYSAGIKLAFHSLDSARLTARLRILPAISDGAYAAGRRVREGIANFSRPSDDWVRNPQRGSISYRLRNTVAFRERIEFVVKDGFFDHFVDLKNSVSIRPPDSIFRQLRQLAERAGFRTQEVDDVIEILHPITGKEVSYISTAEDTYTDVLFAVDIVLEDLSRVMIRALE